MRTLACAALLLALPFAHALPGPVLPAQTALPVASGSESAASGNATGVAAGDATNEVYLEPLGDVQGDGQDDILVVTLHYVKDQSGTSFTATGTARSGANLATTLFSVASKGPMNILTTVPDADGDGIREILQIVPDDPTSTNTGQSAGVGALYKDDTAYPATATLQAGRDGHDLLSFPYDAQNSVLIAYAFPVAASAFAETYGLRVPTVEVPLPHSVATHTYGYQFTYAGLFTLAGGDSVSAYQRDEAFTMRKEDGSRMVDVDFAAAGHATSGLAFGDLDGDGVADAAVGDLVRLTQVSPAGVQAYKPTFKAVSGKDASTIWAKEQDIVVGEVEGPLAVGDLDGDGGQDVEFLVVQTLPEVGLTTLVLSGKTGATLGTSTGAQAGAGLLFGPAADGKHDEMLAIAGLLGGTITVGPSGADFKARWTTPLGNKDVPAEDTLGYLPAHDWTGDGQLDLALLRNLQGSLRTTYTYQGDTLTRTYEVHPYNATLEVVDGATGKPAWSSPLTGALAWQSLSDFDGDGAADFAAVTVAGGNGVAKGDLRGATLTLRVLSGHDGHALLEQVLRSPEGQPVASGAMPSILLRDLRVHGAGGLGVGLIEPANNTYDGTIPPETWYYFRAGVDALAVHNEAGKPAAQGSVVDAPVVASDLPAPAVAPTQVQDATTTAAKGSPAPMVPLVAAGLAAALLLRRRKGTPE